jgi:hypothetical protein
MAAPFGFSFGDSVAAIQLVSDLVAALKESTGAVAQYRDLMTELHSLELALMSVGKCELAPSSKEYRAMVQAVGDCRQCITTFLEHNAKYQPLTAGHLAKRDQILKIKWSLCHKDDVENFRKRLAGRTSSLLLLLNAIQLLQSNKFGANTDSQMKEQTKLLGEIHGRLGQEESDHSELLEKMESLLISREAPPLYKAKPSFEVRPLRLTGGPVVADYVERSEVLASMESAMLPITPDDRKIVVL